jgi:hypothetical protein
VKKLIILLAALALMGVGQASAVVVTFDDLSSGQILNGYEGLNWENFFVLNGNSLPGTGYEKGIISPYNVIYNGWGLPAATSDDVFTFNSAYFTAAWESELHVTVTGYLNGSLKYTDTFSVTNTEPAFKTFNWQGINKIGFETSSIHPPEDNLNQVAIDNFTYNECAAVPEPATIFIWSLFGGLGVTCAWWRRRAA